MNRRELLLGGLRRGALVMDVSMAEAELEGWQKPQSPCPVWLRAMIPIAADVNYWPACRGTLVQLFVGETLTALAASFVSGSV